MPPKYSQSLLRYILAMTLTPATALALALARQSGVVSKWTTTKTRRQLDGANEHQSGQFAQRRIHSACLCPVEPNSTSGAGADKHLLHIRLRCRLEPKGQAPQARACLYEPCPAPSFALPCGSEQHGQLQVHATPKISAQWSGRTACCVEQARERWRQRARAGAAAQVGNGEK
jgi:hypothetical protein